MATQLRPNLFDAPNGSFIPPVNLTDFGGVQQPTPSTDQSATVIRTWAALSNPSEDDPSTVVFTCWTAGFVETDFTAGLRQVGDAITVTVPAVDADADPTVVPIFLQFIDTAQPQAGAYMVAYDGADKEDGTLTDPWNVIYPVAP